ncbi:MAG: hypothetical protein KatS3mg114_1038 [Planctomycetaceae bacterium]|nr:MAG: hypothetical protein KatS3mg114_1038 [Planctomycetaceae bacterium]
MSRWLVIAAWLLIVGWSLHGRAQSADWQSPMTQTQPNQVGTARTPGSASSAWSAPAYPGGPYAYGSGRMIFRELPDDTGWAYDESPLEHWLAELFRHVSFRVDYLLWDMTDPGDNILGSPTNFVTDPTQPFAVINPVTGVQMDVVAPSLRDLKNNNNNGIRGTFSFHVFEQGVWETSVFALQTSTSTWSPPTVLGLTTIDLDDDGNPDTDINGNIIQVSTNILDGVAQSTLLDGQIPVGNNFFLIYDAGYHMSLKTSVWGVESHWISAPYDAGMPVTIAPLVGVRYFQFNEDLRQGGRYSYQVTDSTGAPVFDPVTGNPVLDIATRTIDATTNNYLYGPQVGLHAEWRTQYFSLGAQPRVMLGLNSYKIELAATQVLSPTDPVQFQRERNITFGILGELDVFTRIHLTPQFSLFTAYNLMWAGLITRPADNFVYNVQRSPRQSNFYIDTTFTGVLLHGLSIGGEVRW